MLRLPENYRDDQKLVLGAFSKGLLNIDGHGALIIPLGNMCIFLYLIWYGEAVKNHKSTLPWSAAIKETTAIGPKSQYFTHRIPLSLNFHFSTKTP